MTVYPPCENEADRYSLEALRSIHQMMDDDQDGGIEVEESMEVQILSLLVFFVFLVQRLLQARGRQSKAVQQQVCWLEECSFKDSNRITLTWAQ